MNSRKTIKGRVLRWAVRLPHRKNQQNDITLVYGLVGGKRRQLAVYEFPRHYPAYRCASMALHDHAILRSRP